MGLDKCIGSMVVITKGNGGMEFKTEKVKFTSPAKVTKEEYSKIIK